MHYRPVFAINITFAGLVSLTLLACAGKSTESPAEVQQQAFVLLREEAGEVIQDPGRAAQAVEIINALESGFQELGELLEERSARYQVLHADYDVSRAELDEFFENVQADMVRNQQQVSELHRQLIQVTTPDEWVQLGKSRNAVMDAATQSVQQGTGS